MKRSIRTCAVCLTLVLLLSALTGCSSGRAFEPTGNGLYVSRDGVISTAFIVDVDESYYSEEDMRTFCETEVSEFNASQGASATAYQDNAAEDETLPVAIESFTYGDQAQLILTYASTDAYLAFNADDPASATALMYAEAQNTVGMPEISLVSVEDGSRVAAGSVVGDDRLKILMVEGAVNVQVQGRLVYTSENVTVTGEDTATTSADGSSYLVFR